MAGGVASRMTATARRLERLPVTSRAWVEGTLSAGQVHAITANVTDGTIGLFAEHEPALVPSLAALSAREAALAMQAWRARAEAVVTPEEPAEPARSLHLSRTLDGRGELTGSLGPHATTVVGTALRLASTNDAEGQPARTPAERRADALVELCQFFLDHQTSRLGGRHRPHLNVVMRYEDLVAGLPQGSVGHTVDGQPVDAATLSRLLCDSAVHRVLVRNRSAVLDYGTSTRVVSPSLFAAVALRDQHCRHPGCDRPPQWCEAHHVVPVEARGPTCMANLVLRCSRHHHLVHRRGWRETLDPDGTLHLTDPSGRSWTTAPPGLQVPLAA
jgi:hypothetical protein